MEKHFGTTKKEIIIRLQTTALLILLTLTLTVRASQASDNVKDAGDPQFLLFYSANVLGELEPCGG